MQEITKIPDCFTEPLASVLNTLRLTKETNRYYRGSNLRHLTDRVYGGQVFAQAVIASADTIKIGSTEILSQPRPIHSITAAFLRPGKVEVPTELQVVDVLDGNSFSTRRILAYQNEATIFSARASFQEVQPGVEHATPMPTAPAPDTLDSSVDFFAALDFPAAKYLHRYNVVDLRHVAGPIWVQPQKHPTANTKIWFKLRSPLPQGADQTLHRAMLAYATDQFMLEPIMRAHGQYWLNPQLSLATLDHTIWWHRDVDLNHWILAELTSPSAQGGRGLSVAKFFQEGVHIASMAQEGMIRVKTK
ncbi:acyl-CoA thioesterase [Arcanobacterium hippocoleae]|uniref:Acyl-CoA thioesterase-2 n=1 Tax=Arcanobacterium hippocoleae TaxID=149017 RepID=A0ABU1T1C1_9ACTO|nr:acyl-CoA thioesterase domain-containing protein [Arcanobacterium hippocoleae]MDR6939160.1 acyl-CoA thioesterase-2 [Arcanobacterium hippocoleae]